MKAKDPKGYYQVLGVSPSVSTSAIEAAYARRIDRKLVPVRDSNAEGRLLDEAFAVLRDPLSRMRYDEAAKAFIPCSGCQKITPLPRHIGYHAVVSVLLFTQRSPVQGIYCNTCAGFKAAYATTISWLLGWWGFPWGFIYTPLALITNLAGGIQSRETNASLAARQAIAYAKLGDIDTARAITRIALRLAPPDSDIRNEIQALSDSLGAPGSENTIDNPWRNQRYVFLSQIAIGAAIVFGAASLWSPWWQGRYSTNPAEPNKQASPAATVAPRASVTVTPTPPLSRFFNDAPTAGKPGLSSTGIGGQQRQPSLPAGLPPEQKTGPVNGAPYGHAKGRSEILVDNSRNDVAFLVKLFAHDSPRPNPVRVLFISPHDSFTLTKVSPGRYDLRFQNTATSKISRTESFVISEKKTKKGVEYTRLTQTLYTVTGGNGLILPATEADF